MKKFFVVVGFVFASTSVLAQPSLTIVWNQNGETPEAAQSFTYRMYLDGNAPVILEGVLCKSVPDNQTECSVPLPIPSVGLHTISMTAQNEYGESEKSAGIRFRYPAIPGAPTNLRIGKGTE